MKQRPSVVITGASSGIGRACALLLAERGFRVFAGVRKAEDADALRARGGASVEPVHLDVTDGASVAEAARVVGGRLESRGLDGLINNAGIGAPAPVEYMSAEALRRQFDVNVFGPIAVTQAFLPSIGEARGRIVNMGSVGAHITIPFGGALCGTKSALRSLNDALRLELRPFGIHVCFIEPGSIARPAVDKTFGGGLMGVPAGTRITLDFGGGGHHGHDRAAREPRDPGLQVPRGVPRVDRRPRPRRGVVSGRRRVPDAPDAHCGTVQSAVFHVCEDVIRRRRVRPPRRAGAPLPLGATPSIRREAQTARTRGTRPRARLEARR